MSRQVTEQTFFHYIKCPHWVYLDAHGLEPHPHDPLLEKLMDDGLLEEKQREIISDRTDLAEVMAEDLEEAFMQTLAFMREGRQTIYHGVLIERHWVGHPDVLERVEGKSTLGDYYYVAADLKHTRELKDIYKFQGCFYAELLERIQHTKPVQGYVITPDRTVLSYLIESFETEYHLTLMEIEKILAGRHPAHFLTSGCRQSPWYDECRHLSSSCDDLSLLNRIWREEVERLKEVGITTLEGLAQKSLHDLLRLAPGIRQDRLEILHDQAIALSKQRVIHRSPITFLHAKQEIYFDIESDPLRDFDYLFGVLVVEGKKATYEAFFAERPEDEAMMWHSFVAFIESHLDIPIYHYGLFEQEVVHRFASRYGISTLAMEALERNMVDLLFVMRPAVIFPLSFYSLKDVAAYLGYAWRAADASGANSVLWFEKWLEQKDPSLLQKIKEYNEDDVRATHHVKQWLEQNAA